jgi:hypothetical protein
LNACCRKNALSPAEFGGRWGAQWPVLAVRRFMLYDVFLHELGHLQVSDLRRPSRRLRYYHETLAQQFADYWRQRLWAAPFEHADPVHNPPTIDELTGGNSDMMGVKRRI